MRVTIAAAITPDGTITVHSLSRRPASSSPTAAASRKGPTIPSLRSNVMHLPLPGTRSAGRRPSCPTELMRRTRGLANASHSQRLAL